MLKRLRMRGATSQDGTIAVATAVTIPVALLVLALALAMLVWGTSETEQQRAADLTATEIAASELLLNFPYSQVTTLDKSLYPTAQTVAESLGVPLPASGVLGLASAAASCTTIGSATTAINAATGQLITTANGALATTTTTVTTVTGTVLGTLTGALPNPSASPSASATPISILPLSAAEPSPVARHAQPHAISLPTLIPLPTLSPILPTASPTPSPTVSPTPLPTVSPSPLPTALPTPNVPDACNTANVLANVPVTDPISRREACTIAASHMDSDSAPYSNSFYKGSGSSSPTCYNKLDNGKYRIRIGLSTQNPLLGLGTQTLDALTKDFTVSPTSQINEITEGLAPLGIHLDTSLPNLICPQVNVEIDQPIKEPLLSHVSVPNGRATARRLLKNAVVVPVFNGLAVASASASVTAGVGGVVQATVGGTANVTLPAVNLNTTLLRGQDELMDLLNGVDARVQNRLTQLGTSIDSMAGVLTSVGLGDTVPPVSGATSAVNSALSLTSCLTQSLENLYDPPTSDAPTADEVMENVFREASLTGDPIQLIQVGVSPCPGATIDPVSGSFSCLQTATGSAASTITGLYDVPLLDIAPVVVKDLGDGNYQAVPVHATQAAGAFRSTLVRDIGDTRYDPSLPIDTTPASVPTCQPLTATQTPLPTATEPVPTVGPIGPSTIPLPVCSSAASLPSIPSSTPTLGSLGRPFAVKDDLW